MPPGGKLRAADVLGALAWGCFFSLAPIVEILFFGACAWIPLLIWLEVRRSKRRGFLPGFLIRGGVAGLVVAAAAMAPFKYEDSTRIGPLSAQNLALAQLAEELRAHRVSIERMGPTEPATIIRFSSARPTLREFIREVESKTALRYSPIRCGNAATVLWGSYPIGTLSFAAAR